MNAVPHKRMEIAVPRESDGRAFAGDLEGQARVEAGAVPQGEEPRRRAALRVADDGIRLRRRQLATSGRRHEAAHSGHGASAAYAAHDAGAAPEVRRSSGSRHPRHIFRKASDTALARKACHTSHLPQGSEAPQVAEHADSAESREWSEQADSRNGDPFGGALYNRVVAADLQNLREFVVIIEVKIVGFAIRRLPADGRRKTAGRSGRRTSQPREIPRCLFLLVLGMHGPQK